MRTTGIPLPSEYEMRVNELIDSYCETQLFATPGTAETLGALDLPICVASSGIPERIRTSLRIVGLLHLGRLRRAEGDLTRAKASFDRADQLALQSQNLRLRSKVQEEMTSLSFLP